MIEYLKELGFLKCFMYAALALLVDIVFLAILWIVP